MTSPFASIEPLADADFARLRRRAIFDCCKWDPQAQDFGTLARFALVLRAGEWEELARLARLLAREALTAEQELLARPDLDACLLRLGLPRRVRRVFANVRGAVATRGAARLMRFDFHATADGWRISEVNSDVPGGMNEGAGLPPLAVPHYPRTEAVGDPAGAYARALVAAAPGAKRIALVHATSYSDDQQVMVYLAGRLERLGAAPRLASPAQLRWGEGRAALATQRGLEPIDVIARFFPGEWLPELPADCAGSHFFAGSATPISNPASALLTQSKRFPLLWDELSTPLPTWRALLPETRDPRDVPWRGSEEWVLKPALGRVGEAIAIPELITPKERPQLERAVRRDPGEWIAQRRFEATRIEVAGSAIWPCVGIFTVDDQVAGAYGRVAQRPLIDWRAQDAAVLAATRPCASGAAGGGGG